MNVLVHCGQGKTGSTTLQATLTEYREVLQRHRVCYPSGLFGPDHKGIAPLFLDESHCFTNCTHDGPRRRSHAELHERGRAEWASILREAAEQRPDTLVLSHESYCHLDSAAEARRLHALLSELGGDVSFCVYIRDPAERYHSSERQAIKTRGRFKAPRPLKVRGFLESVAREFGTRVSVRVYARGVLVGGDIVPDFLTAFLRDRIDPAIVTPRARNDSLSTEATSILLNYRQTLMPESIGFFEPRASQLRLLLETLDRTVPRSEPEALVGSLRRDIVRASVELDWLKDEYGVVLPGIEYPVDDGSPLPDFSAYTRFEDVCVVDHARREELLARLVDHLMKAKVPQRGFLAAVRSTLRAQVKRATSVRFTRKRATSEGSGTRTAS